jgi:hypothetical protein
VKYRRLLGGAAVHAHLTLPGEMGHFLFGSWRKTVFTTPFFENVRQARYSADKIYDLPYTVAEGFAARHNVPRERFLAKIAPKMTEKERLRLQEASDGKLELHPERLSLTALTLYILSLSEKERQERGDELDRWLSIAAHAALRRSGGLPLAKTQKIGAILDNSYSTSGSTEKARRPLGIALAVDYLLRASGLDYTPFWLHTPPQNTPLLIKPYSQTNITERFLDAVEAGMETIIIVSDAVENDPPSVFSDALEAVLRLSPNLTVLHFNPVFDSDKIEVRSLSKTIPAVGLRDAEDLSVAIGFAQFAAGTTTLVALETYLKARVEDFLR